MSARAVFKKELQRFCQTTSVKGIPRAAKAEHKGICVTWMIAVVMMLSLASYQVSMLIIEYLEYPTYTVTNENVMHPHHDKPVLPSLTLCNENPFSSLKPPVSIFGLPTLDDYYNLVDQMTQCPGCDAQATQNMMLMNKLMRTQTAYFQNLGVEHSQLLGHDVQNFIISCKEMVFLGLTFVERVCTELVNITLSPDVDFFNCYRVNLPNDYDMDTYGMISGVALVLYLDNINNNQLNLINSDDSLTAPVTKFGAIAVPTHSEGTAFPALDGTQLPAGISAKIQLKTETHQRLKAPYGECEDSDVHGYEGMKMCISDCFQRLTRRDCNCTDGRMVKHMETPQKPFCLKVDQSNPAQVVANYLCGTDNLRSEPVIECLHACPQACREYGYSFETSFSKWPNPSSMHTFYNDYISGKEYEQNFQVVKDVVTGNCSSQMECMVKYVVAQKLIEDNFLEVKFHISDIR